MRDVVARGGFEIAGVASPSTAHDQVMAIALAAPRVSDLREAALRGEADAVWLAADAPAEPDLLRHLAEASVPVVSSEPQPGGLADMVARGADTISTLVPLMQRAPLFDTMLEVLDQFGERSCFTLSMCCTPAEGSLLARLFDACDLVERLFGTPQKVDAAFVPADGSTEIGETLRGHRGHLTANLRFAGDHCAALTVSNAAGRWFRGGAIIGRGGTLRFSDAGFDWYGSSGDHLESQVVETAPDAASLTAAAIHAGVRDPASRPTADVKRTVALCEAIRLSCRTGQGEPPQRILELLRAL